MRVLVACECSGRVKTAFRDRGHDAWSCDTKPSEIPNDPYHVQDDIIPLLSEHWDLMIAHPDCTYLANSGVRWLKDNPERWQKMVEAREFFNQLWLSDIPRIAVENPIPHKWACLPEYTQLIQPYQFDEPFTKATCLWLKGLPKLVPTKIISKSEVRAACHLEPPGPNRKSNRSRTYQGIAVAFADQWGNL